MKKIALSLLVVAASGAYVWSQSGADQTDALLGLSPADALTGADSALPGSAPQAAPPIPDPAPAPTPEPAAVILPAPFVIERPVPPVQPIAADAATAPPAQPIAPPVRPAPAPAAIVAVVPDPLPPPPRPRPQRIAASMPIATKVSMTVAGNGSLADGAYTGPAVDAYYGLVQIQAIVRGGRLAGIKVLQYPSDRRTSVAINRQALPMLRDEAVAAQSANVDIVSGATLTSKAFIRSLSGALKQAVA